MQLKEGNQEGNIDMKKKNAAAVKIGGFLERQFGSSMFTSKEFFKILGPVILDQFFVYFISMVTVSMVSASSQDSVSAVSLVNPIIFLAMALFGAVASGGTVVVAQYKGKNDPEKVRQAAGQATLATFIVALIVGLCCFFFAEPIISWLFGSAEAAVKEKCVEFLSGMGISMIPFAFYSAAFAALRGVGASKTCLWLTIMINVVHFLLSILLLNILHLDIWGTVLSYILARFIGGMIALYLLMTKRGIMQVRVRDILKVNPKLMITIARMGVPVAMEQAFYNGGNIIVQSYLVQLGGIAVAANAIASSAFSLIYACGFAVSTVSLTIVGQCIGAGEVALARRYGSRMEWLGNTICTLSVVILMPLMPLLLSLYAPQPETLPTIYQVMWIGCAFMPFVWSGANVMPNTLRAAGDATYTSVTSLVCMWAVRVFSGYALAIWCGLGIYGVWISMGLEWLVKTVAFRIRFRGDAWCSKKVVE